MRCLLAGETRFVTRSETPAPSLVLPFTENGPPRMGRCTGAVTLALPRPLFMDGSDRSCSLFTLVRTSAPGGSDSTSPLRSRSLDAPDPALTPTQKERVDESAGSTSDKGRPREPKMERFHLPRPDPSGGRTETTRRGRIVDSRRETRVFKGPNVVWNTPTQ